jgi:peptide/nickel transport system substrate-binding protein
MKGNLAKSFALLIVLTMLGSGLAACGATPAPQVIKETVIVEGTPQVVEKVVTEVVEKEATTVVEKVVTATPEPTRKIVTFAWTQEPDTLNPYYTNMWFSSILMQLYNCWAWEYDDQNVPFPKLVTEIPSKENGGVSEDGRVITMHLKDGLVWSDGTPLTADDFVFTYEMIADPANTVASQYPYDADTMESVTAPDPQTVVVTFNEPFAPWQATLWLGLLPKHVLQPVFDANGSIDEAEWNYAPTVGCGPFNFAEWESGSYMRFVKNPNYWEGEPNLEEIYLQFVPDDASQTAALIAGDADLGTFPPLSDVPTLKAGGLQIVTTNSGYSEGWFFNFRDMASPGARDLKVRQAIAMSIDREAINTDLLLGLSHPVETLWDFLAGQGYVSPDIVPWTYDPEGAKALLEEDGWTDTNGDGIRENADGDPLTLILGTTTREIRQDIQAVAQQQLKQVGIDLQLMNQESDVFFGDFTSGAPCAVGSVDIMEWSDTTGAPPDPDHYYWLCSEVPSEDYPWGANYFGCDETLDGLLQQQATTIDTEARKAIVQEITRYIHDQVYWYGLYEDSDYWVLGPRLTGYKFSGITPFYNILEWDVTQ